MTSTTALRRQPPSTATIADYRNRHRGGTVLVCGCGESLRLVPRDPGCITIGTNDVGRLFDPDYLVIVNPPSQFTDERWRYVEDSRAGAVFSQLDLPLRSAPLVTFRLGQFGEPGFAEPDVLHYAQNSPYVAVSLALFMGASRIGLIGVDFTDEHFFGKTGVHPLAGRLAQIDLEYGRLRDAAAALGTAIVNVSPSSRLTSLPREPIEAFLKGSLAPHGRVFIAGYQFLSCGDVFTSGLLDAAAEIGLDAQAADWSDADLPAKVAAFEPDVVLVVHGRKFARRWGSTFQRYRTAVWLLDEPYEVDDSAAYARQFEYTFVNDPSTLHRHRHAHYLPACFNPRVHRADGRTRPFAVGFVGGANAWRERALGTLASRGALTYVVGGPWRDPRLEAVCRSHNIPPSETAALYASTRIIVNLFRDRHHFNADGIAATSLNPRVYEALACGALVVSEWRPEVEALFPDLPTFRTEDELVAMVEALLADPERCRTLQAACAGRLEAHTYAARLRTVMNTVIGDHHLPTSDPHPPALPVSLDAGWIIAGPVDCAPHEDTVTLRCVCDEGAGSERGLASRESYSRIGLSFEVFIPSGACFVAKVHQTEQTDQCTNSYHLYCSPRGTFLARHNHVFRHLDILRDRWVSLGLTCADGTLQVFHDGRLLHSVRDTQMTEGFAILSVKSGQVQLRGVRITEPPAPATRAGETGFRLVNGAPPARPPRVSIITTVYDRVECLRRCLQSVRALDFQDYEHVIVSDAPPEGVARQIADLVSDLADPRVRYYDLDNRHNNWGIAPAAVGLRQSSGEYVCFLSDDNGYTPDHISNLIHALDAQPDIGFAYSSCRYAGRLVLSNPTPRPAQIDLGQPMFRRELFELHLDNDLPFDMLAWDWYMIDAFLTKSVRWAHVNEPSFIFRLAEYPHLMAGER